MEKEVGLIFLVSTFPVVFAGLLRCAWVFVYVCVCVYLYVTDPDVVEVC